ncbi:solute carrier family 41 member 1-like [Actinia tenebrosa]|uniref:Solute carrier family 41 member 1-like n=1 Tax=Actinia tenebrosa TaxID=6105 RepID=A0A6P8H611_ACTTE|nr:solute carrier family 41 member 1-like [Actinia tenebrosa]
MWASSLVSLFMFSVVGAPSKNDSTQSPVTVRKRTAKKKKKYTLDQNKMVPKATVVIDSGDDFDTKTENQEIEIFNSDEEPFGRILLRSHKEPEVSIVNGECLHEDEPDLEPLLPEQSHREGSVVLRDDSDKGLGEEEGSFSIALQVFFPFLIAGFGTVAAGLLLDVVQHWKVYQEISEIFILVPALLGLKGNLEMTLASRLSTAANIGHMDSKKEQWKLIGGNLTLLQVQATVVGALASVAAVLMGWILDGHFDINHAFLLCASGLVTATSASFVLGSVMVAVVMCSIKCNINPDNVATPIAASLGDLTTLALLSGISRFLYNKIGTEHHWIAPVICAAFFIILPIWFYICHKNHFTHGVLYSGWNPVLSAMVISSSGGLVLDYAVSSYHGIAVFSPVVNGVGGNLVAVQASRLSTFLHQRGHPGKMPKGVKFKGCIDTFFGPGIHSRTTRVLLFLVIPGHLIFLYTIKMMQGGHTSFTAIFTCVYLLVGVLQVSILLLSANWMIHWIWRRGKDPDNYSIPYLTAIGDLLGTALLAVAFHLLWLVGDRDSDVGD